MTAAPTTRPSACGDLWGQGLKATPSWGTARPRAPACGHRAAGREGWLVLGDRGLPTWAPCPVWTKCSPRIRAFLAQGLRTMLPSAGSHLCSLSPRTNPCLSLRAMLPRRSGGVSPLACPFLSTVRRRFQNAEQPGHSGLPQPVICAQAAGCGLCLPNHPPRFGTGSPFVQLITVPNCKSEKMLLHAEPQSLLICPKVGPS